MILVCLFLRKNNKSTQTIFYVEKTTIEEPSIVIKNHGRTATNQSTTEGLQGYKEIIQITQPSQFVSESSVTLSPRLRHGTDSEVDSTPQLHLSN